MMQTAEPRHGYNSATCRRVHFCFTALRRSLHQREVRAILMIVTDVLVHQAFQMTLIQNNDMIEQIPAAITNPALSNAVLPRTSEAGSFRLDAQSLDGTDDVLIEVRGPIEDQILRRGIVGECFSKLLHDPGAAWMASNLPMQDPPPIMRNHEEAVQHTKR